jgi:dipeptidyl aminopeptidase/acylaminoacyl peptidase
MEECPFPGRIYVPKGEVRGGVLTLHGSEGGGWGTHDRYAEFLACHGYSVLALDWCGSSDNKLSGVPNDVIDVNIDNVEAALRWLRDHESVRGKPVAVHGQSRGAELTLLLAVLLADSTELRPVAVSSLSGTDKIVQGFSNRWFEFSEQLTEEENKGRGWISAMLHRLGRMCLALSRTDAEKVDPNARAWIWRGEYLTPDVPIEIERYSGPVLLMHGVKDDLWEVGRSKALEERLVINDRDVETLYMEDEKHIPSPVGQQKIRQKLLSFLNSRMMKKD